MKINCLSSQQIATILVYTISSFFYAYAYIIFKVWLGSAFLLKLTFLLWEFSKQNYTMNTY